MLRDFCATGKRNLQPDKPGSDTVRHPPNRANRIRFWPSAKTMMMPTSDVSLPPKLFCTKSMPPSWEGCNPFFKKLFINSRIQYGGCFVITSFRLDKHGEPPPPIVSPERAKRMPTLENIAFTLFFAPKHFVSHTQEAAAARKRGTPQPTSGWIT